MASFPFLKDHYLTLLKLDSREKLKRTDITDLEYVNGENGGQ